MTVKPSDEGMLEMNVGSMNGRWRELHHLKGNFYGFLPESLTDMMVNNMVDLKEWEQVVLYFHPRQPTTKPRSKICEALSWKMQSSQPDLTFLRPQWSLEEALKKRIGV